MSHLKKQADEKKEVPETPEFSLTKAVEDISQHGFAQAETLKEQEDTLSSLQATLSDVVKKREAVEGELRSKEREFLLCQGQMEHLEKQSKVLHDRCVSITMSKSELQGLIREEEENARKVKAKLDTYRSKMKAHREAVLFADSQTEAHKQLEEKKMQIQMLKQMKEQLKKDLEDPNGATQQMAKNEIDALKMKIFERKLSIAERREQLKAECEIHVQLKKDTEIQNKRHDAIVRRLCCQVNRAQALHRQMLEDVFDLQNQLDELKMQQQSSQGSAVSDY
ncbi:coiled-coil domain-containing protein 122 isoform X1 [Nothobranchius furzeri]|uniref:Transcript variant X1 n=2 Tax=Nothobranchius furzeri TaxID=105023 RepID=A0A9D3C515_NOTFU|nr:transcript variant X1 [Nothobranchius furzeri]